MKSARVALGWPRLRRANGVDDVAAGVVGPAGCAGGPQNPSDGVVAAVSGTDVPGAVESKMDASGVEPKTDASGVEPKTDASGVEPKTDASGVEPKTDASGVEPKTGASGPRQRLTQALARGATLTRAAQEAGVSPQLAAVMVEQLRRSGSLLGATSLCASGLGACHSLEVDENTAIRCAGCPLSLKRIS